MMATHEIHVEHLLGRAVKDVEGRKVGRIEEIRTARHEGMIEVREYLLGPEALLTRIAESATTVPILEHLVRHALASHRSRVPWDRLDLSDPHHPRLLCRAGELTSLAAEERKRERPAR